VDIVVRLVQELANDGRQLPDLGVVMLHYRHRSRSGQDALEGRIDGGLHRLHVRDEVRDKPIVDLPDRGSSRDVSMQSLSEQSPKACN
jgi:hypothetical protein